MEARFRCLIAKHPVSTGCFFIPKNREQSAAMTVLNMPIHRIGGFFMAGSWSVCHAAALASNTGCSSTTQWASSTVTTIIPITKGTSSPRSPTTARRERPYQSSVETALCRLSSSLTASPCLTMHRQSGTAGWAPQENNERKRVGAKAGPLIYYIFTKEGRDRYGYTSPHLDEIHDEY